MMTKLQRLLACLILILIATPAAAQLERVRAAQLQPDRCVDGQPRVVLVVDSSSISTCAPGSTGTAEALCCCLDGTWASCAADTTGYVTGATVNQGLVASLFPVTLGLIDCAAGEVLKRDSGDTEWECAADDTGGGGGGSVALDLGDTGSNDSSAIAEIATIHDDYDAVTEPSANKMLIDFARIAPYQKYDPDRPPSSCATCDEFTGDAASLTWTSKNLGSGTLDYQLDAARFIPPTGTFPGSGLPVHWTTGPDGSATDWVMTGKFTAHPVANFNQVWLMVLVAGTEATPTSIYGCKFTKSSTAALEFNSNGWITATSYTSASSGDVLAYSHKGPIPFWLQLRYVSSTKVLTCAYSADGMTFYDFHTFSALGAHPTTSMGWGGMANNGSTTFTTRLHYFRVRTDATGTTAPYPCGE